MSIASPPLVHPASRSTPNLRVRARPPIATLLLLSLIAALLLASHVGAVTISAQDWLAGPWRDDAGGAGAHVLWHLRLPRVLLAAAVGASLGLAGAMSQALFRNPMADPALLGVTSGAAAAVALSLTLFAGLQLALPAEWRIWLLPIVGFAGALSVCFGLERLARWLAPGSIAALLLSGLAIQALAFALVGLCSHLATDEQLRSLSFWTMGSVAGANWTMLAITGIALLCIGLLARRMAPQLNALALGESAAGHVGINVLRLRGVAIACVALLSALSVAWCGSIGFIGLMAPHLARQWVGADQRQLMPSALLIGGLLLVLADTLARTLAVPAEIPVGIFTALIGAPWFLFLLRGAVRRMGSA